jgi:hypothetical protein
MPQYAAQLVIHFYYVSEQSLISLLELIHRNATICFVVSGFVLVMQFLQICQKFKIPLPHNAQLHKTEKKQC